jgi:hypothetical protein
MDEKGGAMSNPTDRFNSDEDMSRMNIEAQLERIEDKLDDASQDQLSIIEAVLSGASVLDEGYHVNAYGRYRHMVVFVPAEDTPCPTCGGSGKVTGCYEPSMSGEPVYHGGGTCPDCKGTGER